MQVTPAEADTGGGDTDVPLSSGGLQESEHEPTTVTADDTPYTSAQSFEDLALQDDLLKVSAHMTAASKFHICLAPLSACWGTRPGTLHGH